MYFFVNGTAISHIRLCSKRLVSQTTLFSMMIGIYTSNFHTENSVFYPQNTFTIRKTFKKFRMLLNDCLAMERQWYLWRQADFYCYITSTKPIDISAVNFWQDFKHFNSWCSASHLPLLSVLSKCHKFWR